MNNISTVSSIIAHEKPKSRWFQLEQNIHSNSTFLHMKVTLPQYNNMELGNKIVYVEKNECGAKFIHYNEKLVIKDVKYPIKFNGVNIVLVKTNDVIEMIENDKI